jgi:FMN phosphatase YigB (HAD superfamily)
MAAKNFVAMAAYPGYEYPNFADFHSGVSRMLDTKAEADTLIDLSSMFAERERLRLYPDAQTALVFAKEHQMKTAIVTTITRLHFEKLLAKIGQNVDVVMYAFEAAFEESNPLMYTKAPYALEALLSQGAMKGDDDKLDIILPRKLRARAILFRRERGAQIKKGSQCNPFSHGVRIVVSLRRWGELPK